MKIDHELYCFEDEHWYCKLCDVDLAEDDTPKKHLMKFHGVRI